MAPLSKALSGLIFNHETMGSHLNPSGETIDDNLERQNFKLAGNALANIWNDIVIGNFPVHAEWVDPENNVGLENKYKQIDESFAEKHIKFGYYTLMIAKSRSCQNCCQKFRSPLLSLIPDRFPPYPIAAKYCEGNIISCDANDKLTKDSHFLTFSQTKVLNVLYASMSRDMNYDTYNEQFTQKELKQKTCVFCKRYFPTAAAMLRHKRTDHYKQRAAGHIINDVDFENDLPIDLDFANASQIIGKRGNEYLVVFNDHRMEWMEVPISVLGASDLIESFNQRILDEKNNDSMQHIENVFEWLQSPFVFESINED